MSYSKDPNGVIYAIRQLDMITGKLTDLIEQPGGSARPQISPDGKMMAYVKRIRLKSVLVIIEHRIPAREWTLTEDLTHDQQETWAIFEYFTPIFAWTPDSKNIIFYALKEKSKRYEAQFRLVISDILLK